MKAFSEEERTILKRRKAISIPVDEDYADLFNRWAKSSSPQIASAVCEICTDIYDMYDDEDEDKPEPLRFLQRGREVGLLDALVLPKVITILKEDMDRDLSSLLFYLENLE